jgi:peroxiredoxin
MAPCLVGDSEVAVPRTSGAPGNSLSLLRRSSAKLDLTVKFPALLHVLCSVLLFVASTTLDAEPAPAAPEKKQLDDCLGIVEKTADGKEDSKLIPGHSMNGDAFNEGPRQAAVLMAGTGDVSFPVTTSNPLAQKFFTQGVGQLHGFWYFEAERSFRQVAALDPQCGMAYWGMAMANINNPKRAADFIKIAVAKKGTASRHEQMWIDTYAKYFAGTKDDENGRRKALIHGLEELSYEFPDDLEAKAFQVFQLWDNSDHGLAIPSRQAVDALAEQVLAVNPMHPIHHYLIHLWNNAQGDKHALPSAARCGQAAPAIAHMWHMPGHTYSALHRYADAAWQQEASARVDHAYMAMARIMPEQIHNYAHNNDWLVKNLNYVGRVHDAIDLAKNLVELPRLGPKQERAYNMGRERLVDTLVTYELWDDLISLRDTMYLAPAEEPVAEARRLAALGVAYYQKGDKAHGGDILHSLKIALEKAHTERFAAADAAEAKAKEEKKNDDQTERAMADAMHSFGYRISTAEAAIAEVELYEDLTSNKFEEAKALLAKARDIPSERRARILLTLGDDTGAVGMARSASKADPQQVQPLANLVALLWNTNHQDEAKAEFEKLRKISSEIDLDLPVFQRLSPVAASLHLSPDWRIPVTPASDVGVRPELASLGPFRWHPYTAPTFALPDEHGQTQLLGGQRGRPTLVVFYLGSICSRCIEQLNVLAPLNADFDKAGISIVAVSRDSPEGLQRTFDQAKESHGFPFPIVSDQTLNAFKAYRAYDDFEQTPLHGLFLIDGQGLVRWQNISFEPFRDAQWLLAEAKRLLSIPESETKTAAK